MRKKKNKTRSWFLEKVKKIDKLLAGLTKENKKKNTNHSYQELK